MAFQSGRHVIRYEHCMTDGYKLYTHILRVSVCMYISKCVCAFDAYNNLLLHKNFVHHLHHATVARRGHKMHNRLNGSPFFFHFIEFYQADAYQCVYTMCGGSNYKITTIRLIASI